jgi:hypothetical protein
MNELRVTTDVRRDLLASASAFKTEAAATWEYVVNALQYTDRGVVPRVQVVVDQIPKVITISDNGRGMTADDLLHYFRMHGENRDRLQGKIGRGKFGTGKSAAFGIGTQLRVDTRRNGIRNVVALTRAMIDASAGDEIPLAWEVRDEPSEGGNGTTITIAGIVLAGKLRTSQIIEYIERHLQAFRQLAPEVAVGDHICVFRAPAIVETHEFLPSEIQAVVLGKVKLLVHVAQAPLSLEELGISITTAIGNLVAIETAGVDRKELGNYLFGEVEVPRLETFDTKLEPYDSSRSLKLNPSHPVSRVLIPFIGSSLETVRARLLERRQQQRRTELQRKLDAEATAIADVLNKDFDAVQRRLGAIRAASRSAGPVASAFGATEGPSEGEGLWVAGTTSPGTVTAPPPAREGQGIGRPAPDVRAAGEQADDGKQAVDPVGVDGRKQKRPRGGFQVAYEKLGVDEGRSFFDESTLRILINLDNLVVVAALRQGDVEDVSFRRLSYEIAFSEYAIALGRMAVRHDPELPPDDLLYEIRSSLNRVASAARALYAAE